MMYFEVPRDTFLPALRAATRPVDKRPAILQILTHVYIELSKTGLRLLGSNADTSITCTVPFEQESLDVQDGAIAVPAFKLADIVKTLPNGVLKISIEKQVATVALGKSIFRLNCLPAEDYPLPEKITTGVEIKLPQRQLKTMLAHTTYAMATSDPRHYLNGLCLDVDGAQFLTVSTDGHRLAFNRAVLNAPITDKIQVILPRETVLLLNAVLKEDDTEVSLLISERAVEINLPDYSINARLIDASYPDFYAVIPSEFSYIATVNTAALKTALAQAVILSHERHKGVRLVYANGKVEVRSRNPEQEEAVIEIEADYEGEVFDTGFNAVYLQEALAALDAKEVRLQHKTQEASMVILPVGDDEVKMVVMPMRT